MTRHAHAASNGTTPLHRIFAHRESTRLDVAAAVDIVLQQLDALGAEAREAEALEVAVADHLCGDALDKLSQVRVGQEAAREADLIRQRDGERVVEDL